MQIKYGIGIMSGTSLDGIDTALVQIEGYGPATKVKLIAFENYEMSTTLKAKIKLACEEVGSSSKLLCSLNFELGKVFARAAINICEKHQIDLQTVDFIASHGQTIYHLPWSEPEFEKSTLQLGEAAIIAYETGVQVVSNFRVMDMAAGGEGAPLVPYSEFILFSQKGSTRLLQNIGGIGNVTLINDSFNLNEVIAFDTGPGNMIMDEVCLQLFNVAYDKNGDLAAKGKVNEALLKTLMSHPYFDLEPPKSTGRELFGVSYTAQLIKAYAQIDRHDLLATVTMFTAKSIEDSYRRFIFNKNKVDDVVLSGGGAYNRVLIDYIKACLPDVNVCVQEDLGFSSDAKEAIAFVVLANETLYGRPSNVPAATKARRPVILGQITPKPWGE